MFSAGFVDLSPSNSKIPLSADTLFYGNLERAEFAWNTSVPSSALVRCFQVAIKFLALVTVYLGDTVSKREMDIAEVESMLANMIAEVGGLLFSCTEVSQLNIVLTWHTGIGQGYH
eukprot:gb/GECG01010635.1/.p1 GENE.gb/GECG01010635.1/~~gb/GECG01010635.1/.p1  ORF type:complete len:116 (+),score=5.09 gb/GECG01010635.1/:1-348(+)